MLWCSPVFDLVFVLIVGGEEEDELVGDQEGKNRIQ
jgi:hypothetical protein